MTSRQNSRFKTLKSRVKKIRSRKIETQRLNSFNREINVFFDTDDVQRMKTKKIKNKFSDESSKSWYRKQRFNFLNLSLIFIIDSFLSSNFKSNYSNFAIKQIIENLRQNRRVYEFHFKIKFSRIYRSAAQTHINHLKNRDRFNSRKYVYKSFLSSFSLLISTKNTISSFDFFDFCELFDLIVKTSSSSFLSHREFFVKL